MVQTPKHQYASFTRHKVKFHQVKQGSLFSYNGIKYRKLNEETAKQDKPKASPVIAFSFDTLVEIADNKYKAVEVFVDPNNWDSYRLERDAKHTLRFPSKYEYSVYAAIKKYLHRVNQNYPNPRYSLELQFQITLISKSGKQQGVTHVVDFVIRDNQSSINPVWYIEAKGQFLREYCTKMQMLQGIKPNVYSRYLVVSDNEPPTSYQAYYCKADKLEAFLYQMGVK